MIDLMPRKPQYDIRSFTLISWQDHPIQDPLRVCARDFGYEIDDDELAEEYPLAPTSGFSIPNLPAVDPDDFERIFQCFLS